MGNISKAIKHFREGIPLFSLKTTKIVIALIFTFTYIIKYSHLKFISNLHHTLLLNLLPY